MPFSDDEMTISDHFWLIFMRYFAEIDVLRPFSAHFGDILSLRTDLWPFSGFLDAIQQLARRSFFGEPKMPSGAVAGQFGDLAEPLATL